MQRLSDALRVSIDVVSLLRSQRWSARRIKAFQEERLAAQLRYALSAIPYYAALNIDPDSITGAGGLNRFPKITKAIVQTESARLRNPRMLTGRVFRSTTSGSSGEPTTTWFDARSWLLCKHALKIRRTLAAGFPLGQRLLIFDEMRNADGTVPPPRSAHYLLFRETRMSVFTQLAEQLAMLQRLKPTAIYGSPSGVKELCDYAARSEAPLPRVRTLFLASELISDGVRRRLEAQLGCAVFGVYGSTEFKEVACECEHGRYHINFESVFVETVSEPGHDCPRLLITSLVNKVMPLIRFDIGDYARAGDDRCPCGRQSPYLMDIAGREAEFLKLPGGRMISPYLLTTAVETSPGLVKYQFLQEADGSLHLHAVLSERLGPTEGALAELRERLRGALGDEVQVGIRRVDSISRTAAGKHKIVARALS